MTILATLLLIGLVAAAIRWPLVRRLGLRNAVRRPREAMLVMLGCVLGTALIVGSGTVSTSFTESLRDEALGQLGPVDARVSYDNQDDWASANERLSATPEPSIAVATAVATLEVPVTSDASEVALPRVKLVEANYARAGVLNVVRGVAPGSGPGPATAWASSKLAKDLNLKVGSIITVHTAAPGEIEITRIVDTPLVNYVDNSTEPGDNVLVAPGTTAILHGQNPQTIVPRYLTLVVAKGAHAAATPAPKATEALRTKLTDLLTPFNPKISMIREDRLQNANEVGTNAGLFLTTIGAFGIIAGILLLINVLLMLAEERLAELGTMRAVGMARGPLVTAFALEGALYALIGATIGGLAGIGIGRFMVWVASGATTAHNPTAGQGISIHFALEGTRVLGGIAAGFLVSTIVVLLTSWRVSRMDVIRALRGLPDTTRKHRQFANPLLVAGLLAAPVMTYVGYVAPAAFFFMLGVPLFFLCLGVFAARRWGLERGVTVACLPNIAWGVLFQLWSNDDSGPAAVIVVVGLIMVVSGVLLVNAQQAGLANLMRRIGRGRATITSRLGLANPLAHRVRTLLTVGPFALVVFTLVYTEGISSLITSELHHLEPVIQGDYQVYATSSAISPFDFSKLDKANITAIAHTGVVFAGFTGGRLPGDDQHLWQVSAFDRHISDVKPPLLIGRSKRYRSDAAAFRAVAGDPDLVIVPSNFLATPTLRLGRTKEDPDRPSRVGDEYTMSDPVTGNTRDLTVVGVTYTDIFGTGAYYGLQGAQDFFGSRLQLNSALIATSGDPDLLVNQLERAGVDNALQASEVKASSKAFFSFVDNTVSLYRSDLGIGLVVGVAGIGVVLVRSVRERRRQIGTLRAMGFDAGQVGWSFLLEGGFVAAQGIAVGVGLGTVMVMTLTRGPQVRTLLGYQPQLPPPNLTLFVLAIGLLVASVLASAGPARAASKIPPAVALRLVD